MDLRPHIGSGRLTLTQVDPAELSPGVFASIVRMAVEQRGSTFLAVDSHNAYLHAMPGEDYLILQMHELLSYLNQKGVTTLLVLGQHGVIGEVRSDVDLSYLIDCIVLFRFFEAKGAVRTALSVVKSRVNAHERTIRELRQSEEGHQVGEALRRLPGRADRPARLPWNGRHALGRFRRRGEVTGEDRTEERVLILHRGVATPAVIEQVLTRSDVTTAACADAAGFVEALEGGAATAVVTEEALVDSSALFAWLDAQGPWSDFPFVVLATRQAGRRSLTPPRCWNAWATSSC